MVNVSNNNALMALLGILLPERSEDERVSLYKVDNGGEEVFEISDWGKAEISSNRDLSVLAAQGHVLPLLIRAGRTCIKHKDHLPWKVTIVVDDEEFPCAQTIVEQAFLLLNERPFKENLKGVFSKARRVPEGPPRWFYALSTSEIVFAPDSTGDSFWSTKSSSLMCALLALSGHLSFDELGASLYKAACVVDEKKLSEWEKRGWERLNSGIPDSVLMSLLTQINVKVHWKFASAHDEIRSLQ